jgi:hypothetical protein
MRWAGLIVRMRDEMRTKFLPEKLKVRDDPKNLAVNGKITLEWIFEK